VERRRADSHLAERRHAGLIGIQSMGSLSQAIGVKTLDHVTLVVADLERSRRFYVDALGMREVERPGFSFDGCWFQAGSTQIHLILEHDGSGPAGERTDQKRSSRSHHFAFQVDDARSAAAQCRALGVPIVSGPKERPDGAVQVFVTDPDGHMVELCSTRRTPAEAGSSRGA
jgi:catechol 2,3-dioxygenase-like lactoylglutathione lyase family enzyme